MALPFLVPNEGKLEWWKKAIKNALAVDETYNLVLFKVDIAYDKNTVFADLTIATFTGYATIVLTRAGWNSPTIVADKAQASYSAAQTFNCSGGSPQTLYGYAIVGTTSGKILGIEDFPAGQTIASGGSVTFTPTLKLDTL